ncbi:F0F1 ATP synthase subunit epsilon [Aureimonas ureilytica]|uniref:F0F1 ATP synthase subunit epsilon n=1 Tax=Aureimonas ureilytica TaxID=401562 RepID=UPI00037C5649|nr:F0F1 ATP synthase subunit epsilon [Aureimonas ureilytica]
MASGFKFELVSPERLLLSEQVTSVLAPGSEGYFTVMAGHAPLMATLKPGMVEAQLASGGTKRIYVQGGFADINAESFTLLAEHATPAEEMKSDELDRQIAELETTLANAGADDEVRSRSEQRLADLRNARGSL